MAPRSDRRALARIGLAGLALCTLSMAGACSAAAAGAPAAGGVVFGSEAAAPDVRRLANWVVASGNARGLPFIVVDKRSAKVFAFGAAGRLQGAAPALLGAARGDVSPPGIGDRKLADIAPGERITPAGRFEAHLGRNFGPFDVLWIDYAAAVSLHRVVTANAAEHRAQRLATRSTQDNRISYGCINVPARFYEGIVQPLFKPANGIVYILPETQPVAAVFPFAAVR